MIRPLKRHCECGAGITLVGNDDAGDVELLEAWERIHSGYGHAERVSAGEARDIRHAGRRSYVKIADRG